MPHRWKTLLIAGLIAALPALADEPTGPSLDALKQAAEQGNVDAQYELGILYEFGFNFPDHKATALAWYSRAAEKGNPLAEKRRDLLKSQLSAADIERAQSLAKPEPEAKSASAPPAEEPQR